jgi:hypothetical protein
MKSSLPSSRPPPKADAVGCGKQRVAESILMSSCAGQLQHVLDGKGTFCLCGEPCGASFLALISFSFLQFRPA